MVSFKYFIITGMLFYLVSEGKGKMNKTNIWKIAGLGNSNFMTLDESKSRIIGGQQFSIFEIIRQKLKFNYTLITPVEDWFGKQTDNGSWTGMVGQIIKQEADMAFVPIFITEERFHFLDYTIQSKIHPIIFVVKAPEYAPDWSSITRPLSLKMWIIIFLTLIILGFILHKVLEKDFFIEESSIHWSLTKVYWYLFGTFTFQGFNLNPIKRFPSRLLIGTWWLSVVILVSSYSGTLMSFLTYPYIEAVPRTFGELATAVQNGEYSCGTLGGEAVSNFILNAKSGDIKIFGDNIKSNNNLMTETEAMERVLKERFAFIYNIYLINRLIDNNPEKYVISKDFLMTFSAAYAVRKGFPYRSNISKVLMHLFEAGIIDKEDYKETSELQAVSEVRPLTMTDLFSPFVLLISGYILSSICLIFELFPLRKLCTFKFHKKM